MKKILIRETSLESKKLLCPQENSDAVCKFYADSGLNDPSIIKNTSHMDLNDRKITNPRFIRVNQLPQIDYHLTAKLCFDNAIDESSLVRNNQDNDFNNHNLTNINSVTLNTQAVNDNQVITKAYVNQFHQERERSRSDLDVEFYDESNDWVKNNQNKDFTKNKLTNIGGITANRKPSSDNDMANKNCIDDSIREDTIVRFNQTLKNYLKISVGNDIYNLTEKDIIQITYATIIKYPNTGGYLLQNWVIKCNNKKMVEKCKTLYDQQK